MKISIQKPFTGILAFLLILFTMPLGHALMIITEHIFVKFAVTLKFLNPYQASRLGTMTFARNAAKLSRFLKAAITISQIARWVARSVANGLNTQQKCT